MGWGVGVLSRVVGGFVECCNRLLFEQDLGYGFTIQATPSALRKYLVNGLDSLTLSLLLIVRSSDHHPLIQL